MASVCYSLREPPTIFRVLPGERAGAYFQTVHGNIVVFKLYSTDEIIYALNPFPN